MAVEEAAVLDLAVAKAKEFLRLKRRVDALREELKVLLADGRTVEVDGEVFGLFPVVERHWNMSKTIRVLRRHKVPLEEVLTVSSRGEKALLGDPELAAELAGCFVEKRHNRFGHRSNKGV